MQRSKHNVRLTIWKKQRWTKDDHVISNVKRNTRKSQMSWNMSCEQRKFSNKKTKKATWRNLDCLVVFILGLMEILIRFRTGQLKCWLNRRRILRGFLSRKSRKSGSSLRMKDLKKTSRTGKLAIKKMPWSKNLNGSKISRWRLIMRTTSLWRIIWNVKSNMKFKKVIEKCF